MALWINQAISVQMPSVSFPAALANVPRKLVIGIGLFFLLKLIFLATYGVLPGWGGPVVFLLALATLRARRPIWAVVLGIVLLLQAFALAFISLAPRLDSGAGFLVAMTACAAMIAAWGSIGFAKSLRRAAPNSQPSSVPTADDA